MSSAPLSLYLLSEKVVGTPCVDVTIFDKDLVDLAVSMAEVMRSRNGVGLAANQVGKGIALCVVKLSDGSGVASLVNPKVLSASTTKNTLVEGCLSCPSFMVGVERSVSVVVRAQDLAGEVFDAEFSGFDARVVQHEIDHLNGLTIARFAMGGFEKLKGARQ